MNDRQQTLKVDSNQIELVDFRIFENHPDGGVYEGVYGVNVAKVREILVLPQLSRIPQAHEAVVGIFNLRGAQIPAVDLGRWLGVDAAPPEGVPPKVIVTEFSDQNIGLIVHQVVRIRRIPWGEIKPPPPLVMRRHGSAIIGTTMLDEEKTLLLVDVERIIAEIGDPAADPGSGQVATAAAPTGDAGLVLVVDDSGVGRAQITQMLQGLGYQVAEATDGSAALEWLQAAQARCAQAGGQVTDEVQLVITDVEMPRMDGYSLTAAIKADEQLRALPVIMHSSLSGEANRERGRSAGCDEYLVKFDQERLTEAVGRLVLPRS